MYCRTCGKEIHDHAVICVGCGCQTGRSATVVTGNNNTLLAAGYAGAILMPIIGVILAIICAVRGMYGHFAGMLFLSVTMFFFWMGVFGG